MKRAFWLHMGLLALTASGFVPARAQEASPTAIGAAVDRHPALEAAAARLAAAETSVRSARAAGLPSVTLSARLEESAGVFDLGPNGEALLGAVLGDEGEVDTDLLSLTGNGGAGRTQASLEIIQPIFTGLRIRNGIRAAELSVTAARAEFEAFRRELGVRFADAHLGLAEAEASLRAVRRSETALTEALAATRLSFEAGQVTRTDVALAEAQLAGISAQAAAAEAALDAARAEYVALMGELPSGEVTRPEALPVPETVDAAIMTAAAGNPSLAASRAALRAREAEARARRGSRAPQLQLRGSVNWAENQFITEDESYNAVLAAELSVPIFTGGATSARIAEASAEARASLADLADAERRVEAEVRTRWSQHRAAVAALAAARLQVDAQRLALRGTVLEREVGQRSVLDLLRVEADLLAAETTLIGAERAVVSASWRLRALMGDLPL